MLLFLSMTQQTLKKKRGISGKIISGIMNEISFILLDYAMDKSLPGRLIQVIAKGD